ncbi:uncharacterized protein KY384_005407 [Bacidia gigantensis]|uniref:uncharacterized protein n=1 Tax=Bacidia gigantensis TaxID=2732470 RepID=UPI001D03B991|nr:uncharacterized protein KY384_005407 [Bacidia gigantensis]KAG8529926.1 hypothetical protein KY384_005407 [Bacidia gigantensis]
MDGFDPLDPNTYLTNTLPLHHQVTNDDYSNYLPAMGMTAQANNYNLNYGASDLQNLGMPTVPVETERVFTTGYDDFHPDTTSNLDFANEEQQPEPDQQISRDNEMLGFRPPTYSFTLLDISLRRISLNINARLHGMFFVADPPTTPTFNSQTSFPELTCYRRNLFQVTGSITLPRNLRYILTDIGDRLPILGQELQISATESVENGPVKLISVPWKTPVTNIAPPHEEKSEKEPSTIPLDIVSNQDMDADFATFPIAWKRLQFRIATANNGRRRELQQHFVVRLKLVVTLPNGAKIPVAEARSAAIIVRGRSPRNFLSKKETPVSGEKSGNRKGMHPPANRSDSSARSPLKREYSTESNPQNYDPAKVDSKSQSPFGDDFVDRGSSGGTVTTPNVPTPTLPSSKSPRNPTSPPPAPQPLSLTEEVDFKRPISSRPGKATRQSSAKSSRPHPYKRPSLPSLSSTKAFLSSTSGQKLSSASLDSADLLYEYFPLALDDWQPPVDAVYRPHVVHHVTKEAGGANQRPGIGGRNNRYFSSEGRETTATTG